MQLGLKCAKYLIFFVLIFLATSGCDKVNDSVIPNVPFSFNIDLNILNDLTIPGNSAYFANVAFGGVIVSCESPGVYFAYDAACPNEVSQTCRIKNEGILGTCQCCDSKFVLLYDAYPTSGPAAAPLRQYQVIQVNPSTLRIYN